MNRFIPFDEVWPRAERALETSTLVSRVLPERGFSELWVVRDLMGRIRLLLPKAFVSDSELEQVSRQVAEALRVELGAHAHAPEQAVLAVETEELEALKNGALRREIRGIQVYLVDRLVTGSGWATVVPRLQPDSPQRFTLYSVKGGVGRSTTAAVIAAHLAQRGRRVLLLDLDLESPGLSSMLLAPEEHPDFGSWTGLSKTSWGRARKWCVVWLAGPSGARTSVGKSWWRRRTVRNPKST
jgi:hypothetical protein